MGRIGKYSFIVWLIIIFLASGYCFLNGLQLLSFKTLLIIFVTHIFLIFAELIGENSINTKSVILIPSSIVQKKYRFLITYLMISSILGLIYLIIFVKINSDISDLKSIPAQIAFARYSLEIKIPWYLSILKVILYSGVVVAGLCSSFQVKKKYLIYLPLIIILLEGLASAGKSGFLFALLLFFSTKITSNEIIQSDYYNKLRAKKFQYVILGVSVFIFVIIAQLLRLKRDIDQDVLLQVLNRIVGYGILPILAFDQWFVLSGISFPSLGKFTFAGIFDFFFKIPRADGVFQDRTYFSNGAKTNVYTLYRSLILDYGIIGSALFYAIVGYLYGIFNSIKLYTNKIQLKFTLSLLQSLLLSTIIWSVFGSFLAYNTYIFSVILSLIICTIARVRIR